MYNTTKKMFAAFIAVAVGVLSANAADFSFKNPIQVVAQDKTSVSLTWDKLPGANGYIVMYGSKSSTGGIYDNELPDVAETNSATISGLKEGQKVFIAVTAIDSNFNEGATSAELEVTIGEVKGTKPTTTTPAPTATPVVAGKFSIQKVDVVNELEVKVTFSGEVENYETSVREFAVNKKSDKNSVINIVNSRVENKNEVVLELASGLEKDTEYELVAISISDVNGNTIQSGTDGLVTFTAPSVMATSETLNAATPETPASEATPVAAVTATGTDAATAAAQAEALPKTGPREMMIVLLALMLGGIVVFMRRKA